MAVSPLRGGRWTALGLILSLHSHAHLSGHTPSLLPSAQPKLLGSTAADPRSAQTRSSAWPPYIRALRSLASKPHMQPLGMLAQGNALACLPQLWHALIRACVLACHRLCVLACLHAACACLHAAAACACLCACMPLLVHACVLACQCLCMLACLHAAAYACLRTSMPLFMLPLPRRCGLSTGPATAMPTASRQTARAKCSCRSAAAWTSPCETRRVRCSNTEALQASHVCASGEHDVCASGEHDVWQRGQERCAEVRPSPGDVPRVGGPPFSPSLAFAPVCSQQRCSSAACKRGPAGVNVGSHSSI